MITSLDLKERLLISEGSILPAQGNAADMQLAAALRKALGFTADELAAWGLRNDNGVWRWNAREAVDADAPEPAIGEEDTREMRDVDTTRRFNIGDRGLALIVKGLKAINERAALNPDQLVLYLRFVESPEKADDKALAAELEAMGPAVDDEPADPLEATPADEQSAA